MFDFWILSMNKRNLEFIKRLNPKTSINLADNKIETKIFLEERWINVPKTLAIIPTKKYLNSFQLSTIKENSFVIKPVSWSKWNWILIVENIKNWEYKIWDDIVSEWFLKWHMQDILNWDFSLNYWYDKVLIEEKLIPWNSFEKFCDFWLADIRVIVYNLVPVAAMVRVPTKSSSWKANLAQWWIWIWIEVWSWIINTLYKNRKVYRKNFPEWFEELRWYEIPFWDEILLSSSKAQFFVNLWYLALDWVITDTWPKILEINARAGLEIQNVCLLPLKNRLEKIQDLKVLEPEKWVELSKSLFSEKLSSKEKKSKIIYLSQEWKLLYDETDEDVVVKVNLNNKYNFLSKNLYELISDKSYSLELDNNISFNKLRFQLDEKLEDNYIYLWSNSLKWFLISPDINLKKQEFFIPNKANKNEIPILRIIDEKVWRLNKKISLSSALKPSNFLEELNRFIELKWKYNPVFEYNFPSESRLSKLEEEISLLKKSYFKEWFEFKSKFSKLFLDKIIELEDKTYLIKAYKEQDYSKISKYNEKLFWNTDNNLLELCETKSNLFYDNSLLWDIMDHNYVINYIKDYLSKNSLLHYVKVILSSSNISRISVNRKKGIIEVRVSIDWIFREKELDWIIAHEIWVHLTRYLNWKKTWWNILETWTADYLKTEEWLAVYNSLKFFPKWYEKNSIYHNYYMIELAKKMDFKELAEVWFKLKWNDYVKVFKTITRFKKWIIDTKQKNPWAIYTKDKVYLDWYISVKEWIEKWWDIEKLMIWKIKIDDLAFI